MRRVLMAVALLLGAACGLNAQEFNDVPRSWKWISASEAAFTFDGSFTDDEGFTVSAPKFKVHEGVDAPEL